MAWLIGGWVSVDATSKVKSLAPFLRTLMKWNSVLGIPVEAGAEKHQPSVENVHVDRLCSCLNRGNLFVCDYLSEIVI